MILLSNEIFFKFDNCTSRLKGRVEINRLFEILESPEIINLSQDSLFSIFENAYALANLNDFNRLVAIPQFFKIAQLTFDFPVYPDPVVQLAILGKVDIVKRLLEIQKDAKPAYVHVRALIAAIDCNQKKVVDFLIKIPALVEYLSSSPDVQKTQQFINLFEATLTKGRLEELHNLLAIPNLSAFIAQGGGVNADGEYFSFIRMALNGSIELEEKYSLEPSSTLSKEKYQEKINENLLMINRLLQFPAIVKELIPFFYPSCPYYEHILQNYPELIINNIELLQLILNSDGCKHIMTNVFIGKILEKMQKIFYSEEFEDDKNNCQQNMKFVKEAPTVILDIIQRYLHENVGPAYDSNCSSSSEDGRVITIITAEKEVLKNVGNNLLFGFQSSLSSSDANNNAHNNSEDSLQNSKNEVDRNII